MSTGYSNKAWACPFFQWDEKRKVHCEGGCVAFRSAETFAAYTDRFCASVTEWNNCTLAAAINEQYERNQQHEERG